MKHAIIALLAALTIVAAALADSANEKEFRQVQQDRDKAVAAAMEAINQRYQASLDSLLRRATNVNELELAIQIKEALANGSVAVARTAEPTEKDELKRLLTAGYWVVEVNPDTKEGKTNLDASSLKERKSIRYFGK